MLSTSNLSATQAENYFVKDDYYTEEEQHEASFWMGKGAANLGLTGTVEKAVFGELLSGTGPNGEALSGQKIDSKKRRAATDFTFSAPKSVSIAALVQQDERVLAAHHQAVAKAVSVLEERYAQTRVSTDMGRQRLTTGNLVAAVFPHATNREAEPQLHSHCVVMNATQLPGGRWFSFANEQAIANKKLLGQIYQNELAIALKQEGYEIEPKAHGQFELKGYSPELLKLFSTRRQQIEALVALWESEGKGVFDKDGQTLRSRLAIYEAAALKSRKRKPKPMQPEQLRQGWNALAQLNELALPELPEPKSVDGKQREGNTRDVSHEEGAIASTSHPINSESTTINPEGSIASDISPAIQHCSEREAVFRRTKLERFAFEHQLGQQSFDQLQQAIDQSTELIRIDEIRVTTQTAIQFELETIRLMQAGKGKVKAITSPEKIEPLIERRSLTDEQKKAIALTLTTSDQVIAWQGSAGVGKTYALNELKNIVEAEGIEVKGFAPSAEAAYTLGESLRIETGTVAGLLVSQPSEQSGEALWIIDEAGLLSMKDAHALLLRAEKENARVLFVGDTKQLSAVEAGNPFKSLQAGGIALAQLDHSLRQKTEELKLAVSLVSEGHVARGIDVLEQAGCLHIESDANQKINQVVSDYLKLSPGTRAEILLLAGTNQARQMLTKRLRQALQAEGSLSQDALTIMSLRRKDLTSVQAMYVSAYQPGDVLIPTQDYKKQGLVKHQQYVVRAVEKETDELMVESVAGKLMMVDPARCERKVVYEVQPVEIAVGDKLRWTKNNRAMKTRNGQQFVVSEINTDGKVLAVDGDRQSRWFDVSGRQHVDYAWVSTTYSSQGKTADRVLALMGEKTTNRESFYVAVSRAKHGLMLYAVDKHTLIQKAQVSRAKKNASDYVTLFEKGENYGQAQKETEYGAARDIGRDLGNRIGISIGECIGNRTGNRLAAKFRDEFAAAKRRDIGTQSAGNFRGRRSSGFEDGLESIADILGKQAESLSAAITEHVERAELIECAEALETTVTGAVEGINHSFEQLERAAQNRNQLTAAINRCDAAVGRQTQQFQDEQQEDTEKLAEKSGQEPFKGDTKRKNVVSVSDQKCSELTSAQSGQKGIDGFSGLEGKNSSKESQYLNLWQHYSAGIQTNNAVKLDYLIGLRALDDGCSRKVIALILVSGSSMVRQIRKSQGRKQAINYVNKTVYAVLQNAQKRKPDRGKRRQRDFELGD